LGHVTKNPRPKKEKDFVPQKFLFTSSKKVSLCSHRNRAVFEKVAYSTQLAKVQKGEKKKLEKGKKMNPSVYNATK